MITQVTTCDLCGAPVGMRGGGRIDMHKHDLYQTVLTTYPPKFPGVYDLCDRCRDELALWIRERMSDHDRV